MFQWFYDWIDSCPWYKKRPEPCDHPYATVKKWLEKGVPMVEINCPDCGFYDFGHVHADPEDWTNVS
jgi:hypothetical protein